LLPRSGNSLEQSDRRTSARSTRHAIRQRNSATSHAAFGYLAQRYHLTQIPIIGISPAVELSSQRLAEVATLAKARGVTTIFFETLVSPKIAETLAKEVGAKADVLDPIEGIEAGNSIECLRSTATRRRRPPR
jgi:zinc transport system substrate-binding protein